MFGRPMHTGKRGSVIVDAAICLPLFIIAVALLLLLIVQTGREETVTRCMVKSAIAAADAAALTQKDESFFICGNLAFRAAFQLQLTQEWGSDTDFVGIPRMYTGIDGFPVSVHTAADDVAVVRVGVKSSFPSFAGFFGSAEGCRTVVFKPFTGESQKTSFKDDHIVYVFPKYGARYHGAGCSVMQDGCVETVLTAALKKRLSACKNCHPQNQSIGSLVYLFQQTSGTYHKKDCASITKAYSSMMKSEALKAGYTPCRICGGGD
ncbi:MAG: hypothetical protein HUJ80_02170 [Firmicutes bacterium]|nr:hypothetical protein [Bacillota bacterium]